MLAAVGLNPHRVYRRRPSDYAFVIAAVLVALLLVTWAFVG